ncbi:hypothetical protein UFOVP58_136 [uncultured Caudovirales phage]|uniref:Uncharacterized protein n=1 Tax=uncultured Caudovirales phage TaxID=2100421 RepID=A0A6J5KWP6_9CAUD|nr:hypothetical protein UFOVP58_136 [uncultured Caudovirales phage]
MSTILLRTATPVNAGETRLGAPLTLTQLDQNFINLNGDKYQLGSNPLFGAATLANATANFANTTLFGWHDAAPVAHTHSYNIGLNGQAVASASDVNIWGVGVYGAGFTAGTARSTGVLGDGKVSATGNVGAAVGVRGYANDTHAGGVNIGLYADASASTYTDATIPSGLLGNYALYMNSGDIRSIAAQNWTLVDNTASALAFHSVGKLDILKIVTTDGAEEVRSSGKISSSSPTAGIGYMTGAGGAVTQATSKATGVTLNAVTGTITLAAGATSSTTTTSFTLTNSAITATDIVVVNHRSVGSLGAYSFAVTPGAGSAVISIRSLTTLDELLVLQFAVIKSVVA